MQIHNSTAFLLNVVDPRFPLNLTTTRAPILDGKTNLISLNFDGTIYDSIAKTNHVEGNKLFQERLTDERGNSHQIFVHESTLASLFFAVEEAMFPKKLNDTTTIDALLTAFFEIKNYYGESIKADLEFTILSDNDKFISLNASQGIEIGKNGKATLQLVMYCSNSSTPRELAVQFSMDLTAVLNVTEDNYYVYVNIPSVVISNVQILNDKIGMFDRDYDKLLNVVAGTFVSSFNN